MPPSRSGRFRQLGAAGSFIFLLGVTAIAKPPKATPKPAANANKMSTPAGSTARTPAPLTNVPLPIGHEAKGLVLPDFDVQGHMRSRLEAGVAKRLDADHLQFQDMKLTTFTLQNAVDLKIEMPSSVLDLNTRVVVSHERTTVARADFNIAGDQAEFDTLAHKGTLTGNVKMVITDKSKFEKKPAE